MELEGIVPGTGLHLQEGYKNSQTAGPFLPSPFPPESLNCTGIRNRGRHPFLLPHFLLFTVYLLDKRLSRIYCLLSPRVEPTVVGKAEWCPPVTYFLNQQSDVRKCSCHAEEKQICPEQGRLDVRNTKPGTMLTLTEETHRKPRDRGQFTMSKE